MRTVDLNLCDAAADELDFKLTAALGERWILVYVSSYPLHFFEPHWWHDRVMRRKLKSVGLKFDDDARFRYARELNIGQGYDDCTSFRLRCFAAAFMLPYKPAWTSRSAVMAS